MILRGNAFFSGAEKSVMPDGRGRLRKGGCKLRESICKMNT